MRYFRFIISCLIFSSIAFSSCKSTDQVAANNAIDAAGTAVPVSDEETAEQTENPLTHIIQQKNIPEVKASEDTKFLMSAPDTEKESDFREPSENSTGFQESESSNEDAEKSLPEISSETTFELSAEKPEETSDQTTNPGSSVISENENNTSTEILKDEKSFGSILTSTNNEKKSSEKDEPSHVTETVSESEPVLKSDIIQTDKNTLKIPSEQEKHPVTEPEVKELADYVKKNNGLNKISVTERQEKKENKVSSTKETGEITDQKPGLQDTSARVKNDDSVQNACTTKSTALPVEGMPSKNTSVPSSDNKEITQKDAGAEKNSDSKASETNSLNPEDKQETETPAVIVPSRSVDIKKNQYLDVVYPGSGWVYGGESSKPELLRYFGRRTGAGNTSFSLRSLKSGKTVLHFYKNDALTGEYIDDYLAVNISKEPSKTTARVKAPDYASIIPSKPERRGFTELNRELNNENSPLSKTNKSKKQLTADTAVSNTEKPSVNENKTDTEPEKVNNREKELLHEDYRPSDSSSNSQDDVKTVISTAQKENSKNQNEPVKEDISGSTSTLPDTAVSSALYGQFGEPEMNLQGTKSEDMDEVTAIDDSLLEKAIKLYNEKNYEESLRLCELYIANSSTRLDEAYFLCGQNYESESSVKDIKKSIEAYKKVTDFFPFSKKWKNADQRVIYLNRFYINIR